MLTRKIKKGRGDFQVGTSETTRAAITFINKLEPSFGQRLAGVIDGDGCFLVSSKEYSSLEITMGLENLSLLQYIQDNLGGSIKERGIGKALKLTVIVCIIVRVCCGL